MQQNKDEEEECWNTKNTPVTDLEVSSQVTPVQAQGCTSDSNQSWRSPFSSAIELLKSRRIWPSVDNAVAVVIALSSSLWSKIRRMMMIIMIAFMISSSKLTVVAVEQYLHDLIIFFFLPPLKQAWSKQSLFWWWRWDYLHKTQLLLLLVVLNKLLQGVVVYMYRPLSPLKSQVVIRIFPSMQYMKVVFGSQEHTLKLTHHSH